ncbi:MAG: KEOPS complex subunit Cgi121 [Euryarchaeota archaeon]|nr:KEOPS complex subunit Cgi121 [Euryarchaeota archaeon]
MIRVFGATGVVSDVEELVEQALLFSKKYSVVVQVLNADMVFGENHLISASEHAIRAMRQKRNSTNSVAMEVLLYASGERQIKLGIQKMGVRSQKSRIAFVVIDQVPDVSEAKGIFSDADIDMMLKELGFVRDDKVLEGARDTLKNFGFTDKEMKTVVPAKYGQLILERVAMVDVIK